jgi:hypothetical protein
MNPVVAVAPRITNLEKPDGVLMNVSHLETENVIPLNGLGDYRAGDQIEFHYTTAEAIDWTSTYLRVRFNALTAVGGNTLDNSSCLHTAHSLFKTAEVYHDEQSLVERFNSAGPLINSVIMASEASKDWIETEGNAFLGLYTKYINPDNITALADVNDADKPSASGQRTYLIPLCFIHPFFGADSAKMYPVLGSRIRFVLRLDDDDNVLSIRNGSASYKLDNVELCVQKVVLEPEYKQELMTAIRSNNGWHMDYIDCQEVKVAPKQSSKELHSVENQYSNLLTIGVLRKPANLNVGALTDKNRYQAFRCPLANQVDKLMITSGGRSFTNGSKGATRADLYALFEKASSNLCNIAGTSGFLDFKGFYNGTYGFSPLLVSTEKYNMSDLDVSIVNRGLSALDQGVTSKIDIEIDMSSNLGATDQLFVLMFHQKRVHWDANGLRVIR